jgi:hypothetical protein
MSMLFHKNALISRLTYVLLIILFFIPFTSAYGVSISCLRILLGIEYMGFRAVEGTFWAVFVLLIPLAGLIVSFLNVKLKTLILIGLSIFGLIMTGVLGGEVGSYNGGLVIFIYVIGYIILLILHIIFILNANRDTTGSVVKQAAANINERVKNTISDIGNHDTKKANSIAEQLKTYKDLLDQGIITQEEFEKKKSEIL